MQAGHIMMSTLGRSNPAVSLVPSKIVTRAAVAAETGLQRMPTWEATAEMARGRSGRSFCR